MSLPTQFNGQKQAPVGALSGALAKLQANRPLRELREIAKGITKQLPENVQEATAKIDECVSIFLGFIADAQRLAVVLRGMCCAHCT